ncbi:MAG: hypothetical protein AAFV53_34005 [Myxococcota bacterium]
MTITRNTEAHVREEAAFFSAETSGLSAEGSTVCFNVSGFDPNNELCMEPYRVSLSAWLTGKFAMLDMCNGTVLDFEDDMMKRCRSVLDFHTEGLQCDNFVGFFGCSIPILNISARRF